jgi:hypothetical protein
MGHAKLRGLLAYYGILLDGKKVSRPMRWDKMRRLWQRRKRQRNAQEATAREHGQSLVEFAIILPVLLLIVLGAIDLGMGFKTYIALTNAAREGVRWISIHPTDQDGARARVEEEALRVGLEDGIIIEDGYTVRFTPNQPEYAAGEKVTVNVDYNYEMLFGALTGLPQIPFSASSTMVVLYDE